MKDTITAGTDSGQFAATHWSIVLQAGGSDSLLATEALAALCRAYWFPLYAYVRRQGYAVADAQDLTQEFFARLLARRNYLQADRRRGRFRSFLLTSLKHFLINEWSKANRQKRGGGRQIISLDAESTETQFMAEPADGRSPDKEYERRWTMALLARVLDQLQREYAATERGHLFEQLKVFLTGEEGDSSYAEIASRLGMSEGSLKVTVHRLRRRYRELLREEVASTLASREAIDDEMSQLFAALCD